MESNSKNKKRALIVGLGAVARLYHLPILKRKFCEIYVLDPFLRSNERNIQGIRRFFDSWEEIKNLKFDLTVITTPPKSHFEALLSSIKCSSKILVEKPALLSENELDHIIESKHYESSKIFVNQIRRYFPNIVFIKKCIDQKTFGNLISIEIVEGYKDAWESKTNYNKMLPQEGGGHLADTGIHLIDTLTYFIEDDFDILKCKSDIEIFKPDTNFSIRLTSKKEKINAFLHSDSDGSIVPRILLEFENCKLISTLDNLNELRIVLKGGEVNSILLEDIKGPEDAFSEIYEDIINHNTNTKIEFSNNIPSLKLFFKIQSSLLSNKPNSILNLEDKEMKKVLVIGGNSWAAKDFIKRCINDNYEVWYISRSKIQNLNTQRLIHFQWEEVTKLYKEDFKTCVNFAFDTTLSLSGNKILINKVAMLMKSINCKNKYHLSSIAVLSQKKDKYSKIKLKTERWLLNRDNSVRIIRCGNIVGINSPLWVNPFFDALATATYLPEKYLKNPSNILFTYDLYKYIINNEDSNLITLTSLNLNWGTYISILAEYVNINPRIKDYTLIKKSVFSELKDVVYLAVNDQRVFNYLKTSSIKNKAGRFKKAKEVFFSLKNSQTSESKNEIISNKIPESILRVVSERTNYLNEHLSSEGLEIFKKELKEYYAL